MTYYTAYHRARTPTLPNRGYFLRHCIDLYARLIHQEFDGTLVRLALASDVLPDSILRYPGTPEDPHAMDLVLDHMEAERLQFLAKFHAFIQQRRREKRQSRPVASNRQLRQLYAPDYFLPQCTALLPWRHATLVHKTRTGYLDREGNWAIPPVYERGGNFTDSVAPVQSGGRWGYINSSGAWVIEPRFHGAGHFVHGEACVTETEGWQPRVICIDKEGRQVRVREWQN